MAASPLINSIFAYGNTGPTPCSDGSPARERFSRDSAQVVQDAHGRYTESNSRGNIYYCVNSAAQALSLTGTTTYTGLVVYNNVGSTKSLAILNVSYAVTVAETGVGGIILFSQAVAGSIPSLTTTNVSCLSGLGNGSASPNAKIASSCTLAANPIFLKPMISVPWVTGTAQAAFTYNEDIGGQLMIPPGGAVGIVAVTTALTGIGYISWEEVSL